ncbi:MAG: (2Fe-2S) ferredoxin domain-containing protein [Oligoflexia bacterium]|nr:(2Fe-2S) ferredoxin domain-containing protein [Oligoflexia bacterium]
MKKEQLPKARIFVCVNEKPAPKESCLAGEGEKCVTWLRDELRARGKSTEIWVSRTKCQSYCSTKGTVVTFEPTHEQYSEVVVEDLKPLLDSFLEKL